MPEPELNLNSLSRFSKQSPRLVLEEYSHCEVPAGCGGVVMRWRNPDAPIPMVSHYFSGNGTLDLMALDGGDIRGSAKTSVPFGKHALTFGLRDVRPAYAFLLFAAHMNKDYVRILRPQGDTDILSLPDGSWRYSLDAPEDERWQQPDFDDSAWEQLIAKPFGPLPRQYGGGIASWTRDITQQGAVGLGIPTSPTFGEQLLARLGHTQTLPAIYVRKTFEVLRRAKEE